MKCKSVACIWSGAPPVHKVTAVAALHEPPTLYTGGSDGSIIWWNLNSSLVKPEIRPVAMLCGHASPIADLEICYPLEPSEKGNLTSLSDVPLHPNSVKCGALFSAGSDGVLCVWSRASGHCRRRRKLPPWTGSPFMIRTLPNKRYVCITCTFTTQEQYSTDLVAGRKSLAYIELQNSTPSKCTVIMVDSFTLEVVQTIFHGNVCIGPLMSTAVVFTSEDMETQSVMIIDVFGKALYLPIEKDSDLKGQTVPVVSNDSSNIKVMDWADESKEKESLMAFAKQGCVLALVHKTYCSFRQAHDGIVFGKISFTVDQLCFEDKLYVVGGKFLKDYTSISSNGFVEEFLAWNNIGSAAVYRISFSNGIFKHDILSVIPAVLHPSDMRLCFSFIPLHKYVVRVESICFHVKIHKFWRPHVTIWPSPVQHDRHGDSPLKCDRLAESDLFDNLATDFSLSKTDVLDEGGILSSKMTSFENNVPSPSERDSEYSSYVTLQGGELVSSSMVISENYPAPYAIVYGFFNGDIQIVRFHMFFSALETLTQNPSLEAHPNEQKHRLSGHKGAVLCLASHQMVSKPAACSSNHVLLSGSVDCTVRVWDLESGNLVTVFHQHVAPVRQIILPPTKIEYPWSDCFLTVGDDLCVALVSLKTLRVERLFPGHVYFPEKVLWDGVRGYIACLCPNHSENPDLHDILYIWDVKTGARERVLRGAAAHSMFDHFLKSINGISLSSNLMNGNTSVSSLVLSVIEPTKFSQFHPKVQGKGITPHASAASKIEHNASETSNIMNGAGTKPGRLTSRVFHSETHPIRSSSPFPGVSILSFDLSSLMSLCSTNEFFEDGSHLGEKNHVKGAGSGSSQDGPQSRADYMKELGPQMPSPQHGNAMSRSAGASTVTPEHHKWVRALEGCLLQFSLSFLHLWDVDKELDNLLVTEMHLIKPDSFIVSSGMLGDRGSMTLTFPGSSSTLELWRSSSEYSALRSLTMVSLAQHLISLNHSCSSASGALAAFYTRKFAEKILDIKLPLLQLLASFWQSEFEHVKMAARSLFHCAASRAIPRPLCCSEATQLASRDTCPSLISEKEGGDATVVYPIPDVNIESHGDFIEEDSKITSWLESYEMQDWISCVGGTTQDAMTSQIIVAAALAVWYPSIVKPRLATVVVHSLIKLVMAINEKYSAAAAEILAEGMESTWKVCIGSEIPRLIGDIFFQVECVSGASANASSPNYAAPHNIRETLVGILLPSLAMADIPGFLHVIESQIWSTASDSPVHVVSLMNLIRVVRGSPRNLAPYLEKVVIYILQTMDPSNSTMRRSCLQSSMMALKEVVRVFPMVALNDTSTRLAIGDAIGDIKSASIRVYDMQSMSKIKVLDAIAPPGLPNLFGGDLETAVTTSISTLSFSPDGEGLVAFSENGLMIRWWSLGSVWWEKLNRNLVPVRCSKLILVPEWEGFSPNSTRTSIMASVLHENGQTKSPTSKKALPEMDRLKLLVQNLDLSYRLEWVGERTVKLLQHSNDIGSFQL